MGNFRGRLFLVLVVSAVFLTLNVKGKNAGVGLNRLTARGTEGLSIGCDYQRTVTLWYRVDSLEARGSFA